MKILVILASIRSVNAKLIRMAAWLCTFSQKKNTRAPKKINRHLCNSEKRKENF